MMEEDKFSLEECQFSLCEALCVEPDEMWRYDGKVYRVYGNRRQVLYEGEWHSCADEIRLMEILENPESIERSGKNLDELKAGIKEIEKEIKEWSVDD